VSGIAQSKVFESYVRSQFSVVRHFDFPDHHFYARDHINKILDFCKTLEAPVTILTTEKDMVRLIPFKDELSFRWFYIPIETVFVENGAEFDALIRKAIQS
jgi:tetraacyldisaccharide 4'-kinase